MKNKFITSLLILTLTFSCGIAAQAEENATAETTTAPATTTSSVPKTGDTSAVMVYALLMTIAAAVIVRMKKTFTI